MMFPARHTPLVLLILVTLTACGGSATRPGTGSSISGNGSAQPTPADPNNGGSAPGDGNGPTVATVGRFTTDPNGPEFAWSGSALITRFSGTSLKVTLNEEAPQAVYGADASATGNFYDVVIDGGAPTIVPALPGKQTYVMANNLPNTIHTAMLQKRTEAAVGQARFLGFDAGSGTLLPANHTVTRRLLIIGDSISAGYGDEGASAGCVYTPGTENAVEAYGIAAANILNADPTVVAWKGKGLARNSDGTTTNTMLDLYNLTLPNDSSSIWDSNAWTPQAIVVNLGTNDFNLGVPAEADFTGAYGTLLNNLRTEYPSAQIFCAVGPMLTDDYPVGQQQLTTARGYVQAVVQNAADANTHYIEFPTDNPNGGEGCGNHPNVATQKAMGAQLAQAISAALNW